jgi:glycosyltransferase involved in cell wall biosynthesis
MSVPLSILQVGTRDLGGGAEKVAFDLFRTYRDLGHISKLAVGYKRSNDADILRIPHECGSNVWSAIWWRVHTALQPVYSRSSIARRMCRISHALAAPRSLADRFRGLEDFHYPGTRLLPMLASVPPDILHAHNLHGGYFDLRELPSLCRQTAVVLTLHDAWLMSGHCAHSLECDRWRSGCGACPDLTLYPAVRRDRTAANWERKRSIFEQCRLHVATPCRWLAQRVGQSILAPAVAECRVIPYGIDLGVFRPADRQATRAALGLDPRAAILLFAANGIRRNPWKDFATMRAAVARMADTYRTRPLVFLALGEGGAPEHVGHAEIRFVPFQSDPLTVGSYYQAADVYVHAARADTFPNAVLEALACGTPVVATAVGGIPEQIESFDTDSPNPTGAIVAPGNSAALANCVMRILDDADLHEALRTNAARVARERFDLRDEAQKYLGWYAEILRQREMSRCNVDKQISRRAGFGATAASIPLVHADQPDPAPTAAAS